MVRKPVNHTVSLTCPKCGTERRFRSFLTLAEHWYGLDDKGEGHPGVVEFADKDGVLLLSDGDLN